MSFAVLSGPLPIVLPSDIPGSHAADDAAIARMIAAVQRTIDGPSGWLGRSLGVQTIEMTGWFSDCRIRLPFGPIIGDVIVTTEADDGVETNIVASLSTYRHKRDEVIVAAGATWVCSPVHRIQYRAGYDGTPISNGGTGNVPDEAKQAVILSVQHLMSIGSGNLFLRSEEVEGVGTFQYTVSEQAGEVIRRATDNLLHGLRLYA